MLACIGISCAQTSQFSTLAQLLQKENPQKIPGLSVANVRSLSAIALDSTNYQTSNGALLLADKGSNGIGAIRIGSGKFKVAVQDNGTGINDGAIDKAQFLAMTDIETDGKGNIIVLDAQRVRKISPRGNVTTIAGALQRGSSDGFGINARFSMPTALALDMEGSIFVTDVGNNRVRCINTQGRVETVAYKFGMPTLIACTGAGRVFVYDRLHHCIVAFSSRHVVTENPINVDIIRLSDYEIPQSQYSAMTVMPDETILLAEESDKTRIYQLSKSDGMFQRSGIVLAEFSREICSILDMKPFPNTHAVLFANARDNGVYIFDLTKAVTIAQHSMTSVMQTRIK